MLTDVQIINFFCAEDDDGSDQSALRIGRAIEQAARMGALQTALGVCGAIMTDSMNKDGEAACEACIVTIRALMGEGDGSKP